MRTYLLKINCELHLGDAEPRPVDASQWEGIRVRFPNPSLIAGGKGSSVSNGDALIIWCHEDPLFGGGLGLTAEGFASDVSVGETETTAILMNVRLIKPHYRLRGWPGGSSGSDVIDHILSHRHLRSYELTAPELQEFRDVVAAYVVNRTALLATTQYMSTEERALESDRAAVLDGFQRRFMMQEARPEQAAFRAELIKLYKGRCPISRCSVQAVLEAAHIVPFSEDVALRNEPTNGLILRADLHTLFDKFLIAIHPKTSRVLVATELERSTYAKFAGCVIEHHASADLLRAHYLFFKETRSSLAAASIPK
ncbi:HNH endonuclease [Rhizobium sp. Rhizsp82]|uniref:HNH endonuclease n=1 Tax=Rhizobium sp. Rhizsp82 TaxID=3243057 RepID=UPI0039B3B39E